MRIVIDGNIGAGKTTQLGLLEANGWYVHKEPIDEWPLKEFYEDQVRWAFLLHMRILQTFRPVLTTKHVVYERCMWSSKEVFWPLLGDKLHEIENDTYNFFYNKMIWHPEVYIYLSKDPKIAFEHIQKRNQAGDSSITLEYLYEIDKGYRNMLKKLPERCYVVDANRTESEIHEEICRILSENELFVSDAFRI
jgi:thymidylate kinase